MKKLFLCIVLFLFLFLLLFIVLLESGGTSTLCNINNAVIFYNTNQLKSNIIISFTTMPDRLHSKTFQKALCCMLTQTQRAKEIRLNIPYKSKRTNKLYDIPNWLKETPITIIRCEDYGPATKYIPSLMEFKGRDQLILVYDDDSFMPPDLIETFSKLHFQKPNYCLTSEGRRVNEKISIFSKKSFLVKLYFSIIGNKFLETTRENPFIITDIAFGYTGILLNSLDVKVDQLMDFENLPKAAFFVDDVMLSGHLAQQKIAIAVGYGLNFGRCSFESIFEGWISKITQKKQGESLGTTANLTFSNDEIMHKYYKDIWIK